MFQLIDSDSLDMKEGDLYFVKKLDSIIGELIFVKYHTYGSQHFATFSYPHCSGYSHLWLSIISVYRYVSEEEYWAKVKDKYDAKCLDIVLKRLVNETFEW